MPCVVDMSSCLTDHKHREQHTECLSAFACTNNCFHSSVSSIFFLVGFLALSQLLKLLVTCSIALLFTTSFRRSFLVTTTRLPFALVTSSRSPSDSPSASPSASPSLSSSSDARMSFNTSLRSSSPSSLSSDANSLGSSKIPRPRFPVGVAPLLAAPAPPTALGDRLAMVKRFDPRIYGQLRH